MVYTTSVPLANQQIAATQGPIQQNFAALNTSLQLNHTFNGNAIGAEADGSHSRLNFPNQGSDIVALPVGIAAVQYAKGGNLFNWNGAKGSISSVNGTATAALTASATTLFTVPADCIGYLMIASVQSASTFYSFSFMSVGGTLRIADTTTANVIVSASGLNLQARRTAAAPDGNSVYKYIYWPV